DEREDNEKCDRCDVDLQSSRHKALLSRKTLRWIRAGEQIPLVRFESGSAVGFSATRVSSRSARESRRRHIRASPPPRPTRRATPTGLRQRFDCSEARPQPEGQKEKASGRDTPCPLLQPTTSFRCNAPFDKGEGTVGWI